LIINKEVCFVSDINQLGNQLDNELLQGYLENLGKAIVQKMLDLYQQQSVIYLAEIEQAIKDESQDLWQEKCHKMKGAAGSVGLVAIHANLVVLEKSTDVWTEKSVHLAELKKLNDAAIATFIRWLADYEH